MLPIIVGLINARPFRGRRIAVGLNPTTPQNAAGNLMEPPTSLPSPTGLQRVLMIIPSPPELPPEVRVVFQGLRPRP